MAKYEGRSFERLCVPSNILVSILNQRSVQVNTCRFVNSQNLNIAKYWPVLYGLSPISCLFGIHVAGELNCAQLHCERLFSFVYSHLWHYIKCRPYLSALGSAADGGAKSLATLQKCNVLPKPSPIR